MGVLQKVNNKNQAWAKYLAIGIELALSVIAGLLVGQYFDKKLKTDTPWFTLLGLVLGLIAVINILFRLTKTDDNDNNEPK